MIGFLERGVRVLALRLLIGAGASVAGFTGIGALWPASTPPAPEARIDAGRSTRVLLAVDLTVLAAKDSVRTGDLEVGREFDQGLRHVHRLLADLERADEAAREATRSVESELLRIEALVRMPVGGTQSRVGEIVQRRDRIEAAMTALHERDTSKIEAAKDDRATAEAVRLGGAGLATLGLCFAGGLGLARLCVA